MCCVPNDEERKQFDLPHAMRVFNALKKHKFEKENEIRAITYKRERLDWKFRLSLTLGHSIRSSGVLRQLTKCSGYDADQ